MASILIVDDQRCVRELLAEELILEGYRVHGVGNVASVNGYLRFFRPDVVLLDLCLDEADAFGLFHELKRQAPDVPVIIFTAYDSYREDPRLSQADGYVIKGMVLDELKENIAGALKKRLAMEATVQTVPHLREPCTICAS